MKKRTIALVGGIVPVLAGWPLAAPLHADTAFCGLAGMTTNTFVGAVSTAWSTGANWSLGKAPTQSDKSTGYVCIPAGKTVVANSTVSAYVQAIDVSGSASLTLQKGSKLYVYGDKATRPSQFRSGSTVTVSGATLGGVGAYTVAGTLNWRSESGGASSIRSRPCPTATLQNCEPDLAPAAAGLLTVADTGVVNVGAPGVEFGVNLRDQFRIVVRGQLTIHGATYVAADDGTTLELRPRTLGTGVGRLTLAGDGDWYEGFADAPFGLPAVVNEGLIEKTAGTGVSSFEAAYQRVGTATDPGVHVGAGTFAHLGGQPFAARVEGAATVGSGTCHAVGCTPEATTADQQTVSVTVPGADPDGATMTVTETTETGPVGSFAPPAHVQQSGLDASTTAPATLTLKFDSTTIPAGVSGIADIAVLRRPDDAPDYTTVSADCDDGTIPDGQPACVDRRPGYSSYTPGSDAIVTVRTTGFSRWVARDADPG